MEREEREEGGGGLDKKESEWISLREISQDSLQREDHHCETSERVSKRES